MKRKKISLEDIDLRDERFRISYFFPLEKMVSSLRKIGLMHPPLVCARDNRLVLIDGWKRVLGCLNLSLSPVPVQVSEEKDDLAVFSNVLFDNLASKDFTLIEKAEVILRLVRFGLSRDAVVEEYLPLLGIPPLRSHHDLYLELAQLEPGTKQVIQEKNLSFSILGQLLKLGPGARRKVLPLLIPLSLNKQKEILENLFEIAQRESTSAEELLSNEEIGEVELSEKQPLLEEVERMRERLKRKRYPLLSSREDSFRRALKNLSWPEGISLKHSPFFEGEDFTVSFFFKNREEFRSRLDKLQQVETKKEFSGLFSE